MMACARAELRQRFIMLKEVKILFIKLIDGSKLLAKFDIPKKYQG